MPRHLRNIAVPLLAILSVNSVTVANTASAAALHGKVEKKTANGAAASPAQPAKPGQILQGGVKDDSSLNSSLRVIPGQPGTPSYGKIKDPFPLDSNVTQFKGNTEYAGDQRVPIQRQAELMDQRRQHFIPPISSYILLPDSRSVSSAPGWGVSSVSSSGSGMMIIPGKSTTTYTTKEGVTSYVPGYETSKVTESNTANFSVTGRTSGNGVTAYVPGFEVWPVPDRGVIPGIVGRPYEFPGLLIHTDSTTNSNGSGESHSTSRNVVSNSVPGMTASTNPTFSGVTTYAPDWQVVIATAHDGIVRWDSRYEIPTASPRLAKETLGGLYYTNGQNPPELHATPGKLTGPGILAQAVVPLMDRPLSATGLLLPEFRNQEMTGNITWAQWYKRVARAIYDSWANAEVCVGTAKVQVTVTKARAVSCQVVEFTPAPLVERDVPAETKFREAAIRSVNLVSQYEIPEFPKDATEQSVTFDVDLKRLVDGPLGYEVASGHGAATQSVPPRKSSFDSQRQSADSSDIPTESKKSSAASRGTSSDLDDWNKVLK